MEDARIVELYWERDEAAIAESSAKYGGYCYQIAFRILALREDAEECVGDTWLRAWEAMPPSRPGRLDTFLGKITRNLSLDRWRALRAQKRWQGQAELALTELGDCLPASGGVEQEVEAAALGRHPEACPEGFSYAGEAELPDTGELCPYYADPERPGQIYVYQSCWDEGTGTTYMAYVRYEAETTN